MYILTTVQKCWDYEAFSSQPYMEHLYQTNSPCSKFQGTFLKNECKQCKPEDKEEYCEMLSFVCNMTVVHKQSQELLLHVQDLASLKFHHGRRMGSWSFILYWEAIECNFWGRMTLFFWEVAIVRLTLP